LVRMTNPWRNQPQRQNCRCALLPNHPLLTLGAFFSGLV
jgi:hypothetical protein